MKLTEEQLIAISESRKISQFGDLAREVLSLRKKLQGDIWKELTAARALIDELNAHEKENGREGERLGGLYCEQCGDLLSAYLHTFPRGDEQ